MRESTGALTTPALHRQATVSNFEKRFKVEMNRLIREKHVTRLVRTGIPREYAEAMTP